MSWQQIHGRARQLCVWRSESHDVSAMDDAPVDNGSVDVLFCNHP
jgi:hypothetical protein